MGGANIKPRFDIDYEVVGKIIKSATEYPDGMDCSTLKEARSQLALTRRVFLEIAKQEEQRGLVASGKKKSENHELYKLLADFRKKLWPSPAQNVAHPCNRVQGSTGTSSSVGRVEQERAR